MAGASPDEVRVRVIVDSDTPELLKRLAGSKRQAREIVYLLRLGMQMEMMLSGKVPIVGMTAEARLQSVQTLAPAVPPAQTAAVKLNDPTDIPLGGDLAELTGLDADYFAGAPTSYAD